MNTRPRARARRLERTYAVCREVYAVLGQEDGAAWLLEMLPLLRKSVAAFEEAWAEEQRLLADDAGSDA